MAVAALTGVHADDDAHARVTAELRAREPIFHRPGHGSRHEDFERMMAPDFREVGASGRVYSREYVLEVLEARMREAGGARRAGERLDVEDFTCERIAPEVWLATYRLDQDGRISRRATLWRRAGDDWQILYHQGTLVAS